MYLAIACLGVCSKLVGLETSEVTVGYTCYMGVSFYMIFINVEGKQQKCLCFFVWVLSIEGILLV